MKKMHACRISHEFQAARLGSRLRMLVTCRIGLTCATVATCTVTGALL
jgi:hypothetical protein